MTTTLLQADARYIPLPSGSVHCAVTSPPYWGLRDYGHDGQLGLEQIPDCLGWATLAPCGECYVCMMVQVFREVRRVLRDDGVCFLNLGDSYANTGAANPGAVGGFTGERIRAGKKGTMDSRPRVIPSGLKPKDLCGVPWRVALALQADGWWLRSDIIWHKTAPMPESVTDRPTRSHEFIFLLSKRASYFYDAQAVAEPADPAHFGRYKYDFWPEGTKEASGNGRVGGAPNTGGRWEVHTTRNQRDVWTLGPSPYPGAHFATFPPELPRRCILAGTSTHGVCPACGAPWRRVIDGKPSDSRQAGNSWQEGRYGANHHGPSLPGSFVNGESKTIAWLPTCTCNAGDPVPATVLDPFVGSGTTLMVARALGRNGIGLDLSADYLQQARQRLDLDKLDAWHGGEPTPGAMDDFDALPLFAA